MLVHWEGTNTYIYIYNIVLTIAALTPLVSVYLRTWNWKSSPSLNNMNYKYKYKR